METSGKKVILTSACGCLGWIVIAAISYFCYIAYSSKPDSKSGDADTNSDQDNRHDHKIWDRNRDNYVPGNVGR